MTERRPYRLLWINVACLVIEDAARKIAAAKSGKRAVLIENSFRALGTLNQELAAARRYFGSADFREICEMAGIPHDPEAAMLWVTRGETVRQLRKRMAA